jgi:hypothetical protein
MRTCIAAITFVCGAVLVLGQSALAKDELKTSLQKADVALSSAGPMAFGPEGILFVSDPKAAAIYAVATGDKSADPDSVDYNGINATVLNDAIRDAATGARLIGHFAESTPLAAVDGPDVWSVYLRGRRQNVNAVLRSLREAMLP